MQLKSYFEKYFIEGIPPDYLETLSLGRDGGAAMVEHAKGLMYIFSPGGEYDKKCIGCVKRYFTNRDDGEKLKVQHMNSTPAKSCFFVQKALGVTGSISCTRCLAECIRLEKISGSGIRRINVKLKT